MLFAEILVAVLLVATVITSVRLSKRIAKLQADEQAMRNTIVELMSATETAERAIAGLRNTLGECEKTLAERLRTAERYASDLAEQVEAGEQVMGRIMAAVDNNARTVDSARAPRIVARCFNCRSARQGCAAVYAGFTRYTLSRIRARVRSARRYAIRATTDVRQDQ